MPPTNKEVKLSSEWFFKIKNGVIIEQRDYANIATVLNQLGFALNPPSNRE